MSGLTERGELPSPLDLTVLLPIEDGQQVGLVGSPGMVLADLQRRLLQPTIVPALEQLRLPPASLDHLIVPELPGALPLMLAKEASSVLRIGGCLLVGVHLHGPLHRQVAQTTRALRRAGFESIHAYGAYPALPTVMTLVSLHHAAPARRFLRDILLPYSAKAAIARRVAGVILAVGHKARLFPSAVLIAYRAA